MRRLLLLAAAAPALLAASAPVLSAAEPLDSTISRAEKEQSEAEARADRLQASAASARTEAARLRTEQASAAEAIAASEARLTAADARLRLLSANLDRQRNRLTEEQRPVASLLGGLAIMAGRPPLLTAVDSRSGDELVTLRVLLDSTLPVIRARTAALSQELRQGEQLEQAARTARTELFQSRQQLDERRKQFAELEQKALRLAAGAEGQALVAGDIALAAGEDVETLRGSQGNVAAANALGASLATLLPAPGRPALPVGPAMATVPFEYRLPLQAAVVEGLGSVSPTGVRARGITMRTPRGALASAPAAGVVQFSGPFRDYDGILIIDHGSGWMSLLTNISSPLKKGDKIQLGQAVGRTLGPLGVELSQNGRRYSPALIAGSSRNLSKAQKAG